MKKFNEIEVGHWYLIYSKALDEISHPLYKNALRTFVISERFDDRGKRFLKCISFPDVPDHIYWSSHCMIEEMENSEYGSRWQFYELADNYPFPIDFKLNEATHLQAGKEYYIHRLMYDNPDFLNYLQGEVTVKATLVQIDAEFLYPVILYKFKKENGEEINFRDIHYNHGWRATKDNPALVV